MIPAQLLHRLLANLVDSACAIELDADADISEQGHRNALESFARLYELDLKDTATLLRVAHGETPETSALYIGTVQAGLLGMGRLVSLEPGQDLPPVGTPVIVQAHR